MEFIGRLETQGQARYEFSIPQSGGGQLRVVVTSRKVRDPDGSPFAVVTATDISEQKRAETALGQANSLLLARQRQVEEELQLAERVQQSLAPKSLRWGNVSVETYYQPVWAIGGGYGLVTPAGDCLVVFVLDVAAHGNSSALVAQHTYPDTEAPRESPAETLA